MLLEEKRRYLESLIPICQFIGECSGPKTEVVLRDYHEHESTILYIVHGEVSGRRKGDVMSGKSLEKIMHRDPRTSDFVANYLLVNDLDQRIFRASTYYIKVDQELVGLLSVNVDLSELLRYRDYVNQNVLFGLSQYQSSPTVKVDSESGEVLISPLMTTVKQDQEPVLGSVCEEIIEQVFLYWDRSIPLQRVEDPNNPIRLLYDRGVFNYKGAINRVSGMLNNSPQSLYRYIQRIEEQLEDEAQVKARRTKEAEEHSSVKRGRKRGRLK